MDGKHNYSLVCGLGRSKVGIKLIFIDFMWHKIALVNPSKSST